MMSHKVYFNKSKPKPVWLTRPPRPTRSGMISHQYWSKIWQAQPDWADIEPIKKLYEAAAVMRANGEDVHVDHIVPLKGENVCGLHVHWNLRIVSADHNQLKSNKWYPGQHIIQPDMFELSHPIDFELCTV